MTKKTAFILVFLGIVIPFYAQNKQKTVPKDYITASFAVGTKSFFYTDLSRLDGTNKQFLTNTNWLPLSFKFEYSDNRWISIGLTINKVNHQRIYDADWKNYSTGKIEAHRFTIIDKRVSYLFRTNFFFFKSDFIEAYIGAGFGLARFQWTRNVEPSSYEYGGSGDRLFRLLGLESSIGFRIYPFANKHLGFMVEGGAMQSYGQFGFSYRVHEVE
jgi:hypothetical protein